jgi:hypothetical protein
MGILNELELNPAMLVGSAAIAIAIAISIVVEIFRKDLFI